MRKKVVAAFPSSSDLEKALNALRAEEFTDEDISVVMTDKTREGKSFGLAEKTKSPEGATTGGVAGGAIGGILGALAAAGTIPSGGLNLIIAGPLVATFAGIGAGGTAGGLIGSLVGGGMDEHEAKLYEDKLKKNNALLIVEVENKDREKQAKEILRSFQPSKVS